MAQEPITGGLYYWNAAGTIDRFEFGVRGARAERFLGVAETGGGICVGCHTLSRDGSRIAVGTGIPGVAPGRPTCLAIGCARAASDGLAPHTFGRAEIQDDVTSALQRMA